MLAYINDSDLLAILFKVVDLARVGIVLADAGIGEPHTVKIGHRVTEPLNAEVKGVVVAKHNVGNAKLDEGIGTCGCSLEVWTEFFDFIRGLGQCTFKVNDEAVRALNEREKIPKKLFGIPGNE